MRNKIILITVILVGSISAQSQDIKATEVRVTEDFKPSIPEAQKLNEQASFEDTLKQDKRQDYFVNQYNLKADYKIRPLKAAKVKDERIPKLYNSKVSFGFGDNWNKHFSFLHNSPRSKNLNYGIFMNHFSNQYTPADYKVKNSRNTIHLYAKKINASYVLVGNLDYDRRSALYFNESIDLEEKYFRNRFSYTKLSLTAMNNNNVSDRLIQKANFFISDLNEMSENQIHFNVEMQKEIKGLPIDFEIAFEDFLNYNNKDSKYENLDFQEIEFIPSTTFQKFRTEFELGFIVDYDFVNVAVFPEIKATKELVKDILFVYGGIRHFEHRTTIKSLSEENSYIHSYGTNQSIFSDDGILQTLETTDQDELYVGIRNTLGENEVFQGRAGYGMVKNFANFLGFFNGNYNRFLIAYTDVNQLHLSVNYARKLNNILSLSVEADYYNWDKEVYYVPELIIDVSVPINLREKIKAVPSIHYTGSRVMTQYANLKLPELVSPTEIPAKFHANLMLQYNYTKIMSAYLKINNLTNSKEVLFEGYQEIGFNVLFGINYSF